MKQQTTSNLYDYLLTSRPAYIYTYFGEFLQKIYFAVNFHSIKTLCNQVCTKQSSLRFCTFDVQYSVQCTSLMNSTGFNLFYEVLCTAIKLGPLAISTRQPLPSSQRTLKFTNSEKATKLCEISTLLSTGTIQEKRKVEISQNFVAFSECMNFTYSGRSSSQCIIQ